MTKVEILVGLPGSGKSTYAAQKAYEEGWKLVSSDDIREDLLGDANDQTMNNEVFDEMHNRVNKFLSEGYNVIYDATNTNRKRRQHLINHVLNADEFEAVYFATPLDVCIARDSKRERKVGTHVIMKMYKNLHVPVLNEGYDNVVVKNYYDKFDMNSDFNYSILNEIINRDDLTHDELFFMLEDVDKNFEQIYNLPQDSSYHSFSVSRHTYYVYKYIRDNYDTKLYADVILASLYHDVGKYHAKSFTNYKGETTRYAHFLGHENISAQVAMLSLLNSGVVQPVVNNVVSLVQFHMYPMKSSEKTMNKVKKLMGEELFEKLLILHKADMEAK